MNSNESKTKQTKTGDVQSLNENEVKKAVRVNYAMKGDQFDLRNENRKTVRRMEKTATSKSPQPSKSKRLKEQNDEIKQRLNRGENAGIRFGPKRTEEKDLSTLTQRKRLQETKATTKTGQQDVLRQLTKLQRKCHHKFNRVTKRCELCDKLKSAHI